MVQILRSVPLNILDPMLIKLGIQNASLRHKMISNSDDGLRKLYCRTKYVWTIWPQ